MVVVWESVIPVFLKFIPSMATFARVSRDSVYKPPSVNRSRLIRIEKRAAGRSGMTGKTVSPSKLVRMFHRHGMVYPESMALGTEFGVFPGPSLGC